MEKAIYDAVTPVYLTSLYDRLEIAFRRYNIAPTILYNFDETRFCIGKGKTEKVVSTQREPINNTWGPAESLTPLECISADGKVMPPWFLVKGQ
jgi:hypothetical protein